MSFVDNYFGLDVLFTFFLFIGLDFLCIQIAMNVEVQLPDNTI